MVYKLDELRFTCNQTKILAFRLGERSENLLHLLKKQHGLSKDCGPDLLALV